MKPRTIADALIAKHGTKSAHDKVRDKMRSNLYATLDNTAVHRAVFWIVVGHMIEKAGNAEAWR